MYKRRRSDKDPLAGVVNHAIRTAMQTTPPIPQKVGWLIIVAWIMLGIYAGLAGLAMAVMTLDWGLPYRELARSMVHFLVPATIPVVLLMAYAQWRRR